jgi:pyridoxal phosphate enzyme (YggS family)
MRRGRRSEAITLVAVTKGVELSRLREVVVCGIRDLGENRVQEALPKIDAVGRAVRWHLIGHLQRNKVRPAVANFELIQSLDSHRLAVALNETAVRPIDVLLQVNVAGEPQKSGVSPEAAPTMVAELGVLPRIRIIGLMTIAPQAEDPEMVRSVFRRLRELRDTMREAAPDLA